MITKLATFGAGCFWGVEHLFSKLEGVVDAVSGYEGGDLVNPSYQDICTGRTGHAEVVQVTYDPQKISYDMLLDYFWRMHDPTTPNQQGPNLGTQYRSVIFFHDLEQKQMALDGLEKLRQSGIFKGKIITQIEEAKTFYPAEEYHQDYYLKKYGGADGVICHVLRPK